MTDSDIVKAFESLFKKLLNVKYQGLQLEDENNG